MTYCSHEIFSEGMRHFVLTEKLGMYYPSEDQMRYSGGKYDSLCSCSDRWGCIIRMKLK